VWKRLADLTIQRDGPYGKLDQVGLKLAQQAWTTGNKNQLFNLPQVNHHGKQLFLESALSGKCIDIKDWGKNNGAILHQWDHTGDTNQKWLLEHHEADNSYILESIHATGKVMDVEGNSNDHGAKIHLWEKVHGGADNQRWKLHKVHGSADKYRLQSCKSGLYMEVVNSSVDLGARIHQWEASEKENQVFRFRWI